MSRSAWRCFEFVRRVLRRFARAVLIHEFPAFSMDLLEMNLGEIFQIYHKHLLFPVCDSLLRNEVKHWAAKAYGHTRTSCRMYFRPAVSEGAVPSRFMEAIAVVTSSVFPLKVDKKALIVSVKKLSGIL